MLNQVYRGDIYFADLSDSQGCEQGGYRPVLVIQNNTGNRHSPTVIAAAITSKIAKSRLPTHIELQANEYGLRRDSVVLLEQIRTIDKSRLRGYVGSLDIEKLMDVDYAIAVSFGIYLENRVAV